MKVGREKTYQCQKLKKQINYEIFSFKNQELHNESRKRKKNLLVSETKETNYKLFSFCYITFSILRNILMDLDYIYNCNT